MKKLKIHSSVSLITNSSTVIFTYSEGSVSEVKNLINEILKLEGSDKTWDELFYIDIFLEDDYEYKDSDDFPEGADLKEIIEKVLTKEIEKPQWMIDAEEGEHWSGYGKSTSLYIKAKDDKYSELANRLLRFLYSTNHEATRDG